MFSGTFQFNQIQIFNDEILILQLGNCQGDLKVVKPREMERFLVWTVVWR